jgi:hypothetical protein
VLQRPKIPADALSSAFAWEARVDSWLGQTWLGRVPVKAGSVTWTTSQQVQGTLSLTVPRIGGVGQDEGARDWTPLAPDSPLATMGQVLHVQVTVASLVSTDRWDIPLGRFLITQWEVGATDIRVTGKSLLQRLEDDRLTSPTVPYSGGTLASELRRLVGGHMGVIVSDALTNRPCPSMSWGESRIDAIYEIADAWPARLREGPDGVLYVLPPVPAITERPETTLTDGEAGTVIGVTRQGSRAGIFNRIVARGQEQDDAGQPRFQAIIDQTTGPLRTSGPYGIVTKFFSSPLITSKQAALNSATTMLATSVRQKTTVPVTHTPNPTLTLDTPVELITANIDGAATITQWGIVTSTEIPLVYSGTSRSDVEVVTTA